VLKPAGNRCNSARENVRLRKTEVIKDLRAVAAGTNSAATATVAHAASHLTGRQIVPALVMVTVVLLTLAILFGPEGPLSAPRRQTRRR
jgi:hypothetical protein